MWQFSAAMFFATMAVVTGSALLVLPAMGLLLLAVQSFNADMDGDAEEAGENE